MRVLLVAGSYPPMADGVGDYTQKVYHELLRQLGEDNVSLITTRIENPVEENPHIHYIIKKWNIFGTVKVLMSLRYINPDVVNIQYPANGYKRCLAISFLPWFLRVFLPNQRVVVTIHEFSSRTLKGKIRLLISILMSHHAIIVNREYEREIAAYIPFLRKKLKYIPVGANLLPCWEADPEELAKLREARGLADADPVICYFGFIREGKGLEFLIDAFSIIIRKMPKARLILIGHMDAKYYDSHVKRAITMLRLEEHIILTGQCDEAGLTNYFSLADICVLPFADGVSTRRGSFMAALQHRMPIITTWPKYPIDELVNRNNVLFVEYGDSEALAESMVELIDNNELREMLRYNIGRLKDTFSWGRIAGESIRVFKHAQ